MSLSKAIPSTIRLRAILVVPFVLQILATVGIVGYLSFYNGEKSVNKLASKIRLEVANHTERVLEDYFKTGDQLSRININALRLKQINLEDKESVERYFARQLLVFPMFSELSIGTPDGGVINVSKMSDGSMQSGSSVSPSSRAIYQLDEYGERSKFKYLENFDVRTRPWYKAGISQKGLVWTEIFQTRTAKSLGFAVVEPYYDKNGKLVAVFENFILLQGISDFLKTLNLSSSGQVFITNQTGFMVASSTGEPAFLPTGVEGKLEQVKAVNSSNSLTQATAVHLQPWFNGAKQIKGVQEFSFYKNGERQHVLVQNYSNSKGLNFWVVVVMPESDFMAQIHYNNYQTIILSLLALVVAIALGVFIAQWISRPILRVSQTAKALAQGNLEQQVESSRIMEINNLANSFNLMSKQLQDSFQSLEAKNEELYIAEENYRSIFENALEGIFQATTNGKFINVNPALAKIYGYDSPAEMISSITNIGEQLYCDVEKRTEFRQMLEAQHTVIGFECRSYRKDCTIIWTQIDARIVRDLNGKLLYFEGIVQDITDRKHREKALEQQLVELKIEIDQKKREQEVNLLTQEGYFQELQAEISQVNLEEFWS